MKRTYYILLLIAVVILGLALSGCSANTDVEAQGRIAELEAQLAEAQENGVSQEELDALQAELDAKKAEEGDTSDEGGIELLYLIHAQEPGATINQQLIDQFEAENPDIKINLDPTPYSSFEQKLLTGIATGEGADLFWMGDWVVPQFLANDMLAPFAPAAFGLETQDAYIDQFDASALTPFIEDGTLYTGGISEYNTFSLIYNPDHFEEAGLPIPSSTEPMTWEEVMAYSEDLVKLDADGNPTRVAVGWYYGAAIWQNLVLEPMVNQLGGHLVNRETGEANFDSLEMLAVMEYWKAMRDMNAMDPAFTLDFLDDFANGRTSMIFGGPWALPAIRGINPDANIAVAPLPSFEDGQRTTTLYSWAWFVNSSAPEENQEAAWKFIDYMTQQQQVWWDEGGFLQPRDGISEDGTAMTAYRLDAEPLLEVFLDDFQYGEYQARSVNYNEFSNILTRTFNRILEGEDALLVLEDAQTAASFLVE